jgi:hypothetical protein
VQSQNPPSTVFGASWTHSSLSFDVFRQCRVKKGRSVALLLSLSFAHCRQTPPSPTEWLIIHRYSYRVRELTVNPFSRFCKFFSRTTHPSLLLPNLKALRWRPYSLQRSLSPLPIMFIQQFLNPSLVSLKVTLGDTDDATLQSFLASYPFLCPNLMSIVLDIGDFGEHEQVSPTTVKDLSQAITHHEHLEYLYISIPVDDVALMHIAMSPKLKRIGLVLHPDKSELHQVCVPSDTIPFRNVEHLSLDVWDLCFVTTLLRNQDQMFRSFVLRPHRSRPTTDAVFALFTALASRQRTRSLRSISLKPDPFDVNWHHFAPAEVGQMGYHLTHNTFRPLTSLCHLRELVIDLGCWFSIDDDDLLSLTRNWPSLQVLHLSCQQYIDGYIWRSAKCVTLKGLLSFLEYCPELYRLCLPLDAREVPVDTGDVVCHLVLGRISFPRSPIIDPGAVGEFLVRHFPSVTSVVSPLSQEAEDPELVMYINLWDDVDTLLHNIHFPDHDDLDS